MKSPVYGGASYGSNFLAHVDNDEWKRRRFGSIYTVAPTYIKTYFHKMERHAVALVAQLRSGVGGTYMYGAGQPDPAFNMHDLMVRLLAPVSSLLLSPAVYRTTRGTCPQVHVTQRGLFSASWPNFAKMADSPPRYW